ncbi:MULTISPECIES: hypothetical protein [Micromonospora]|uniref:hypothetical protein n=1 Tax=Micromonospora TaxID=1873 RepID=UPI0037C58B32
MSVLAGLLLDAARPDAPGRDLLAPVLLGALGAGVAGVGLAAGRRLSPPWRGTVTGGALGSAALLLTAPVLGGPGPPLLPIALLWWFLLSSALSRTARDRRRGRPGPHPPRR